MVTVTQHSITATKYIDNMSFTNSTLYGLINVTIFSLLFLRLRNVVVRSCY
jgi:hypothetical protein